MAAEFIRKNQVLAGICLFTLIVYCSAAENTNGGEFLNKNQNREGDIRSIEVMRNGAVIQCLALCKNFFKECRSVAARIGGSRDIMTCTRAQRICQNMCKGYYG